MKCLVRDSIHEQESRKLKEGLDSKVKKAFTVRQ